MGPAVGAGCPTPDASTSYHYLMFDEYPAFGTDQRKVPMVQDLGYAEPASRLTNGLRFIWIIPAIILLIIFGIAMSVVLLIAWFAILFTGKFPIGMFDFMMKGVRFTLQVTAYGLMMTDTYPKWGSGRPGASGRAPASAPISPPPASGIVPPAPRYLRNLLVVLSASTLPPVWHVGQ